MRLLTFSLLLFLPVVTNAQDDRQVNCRVLSLDTNTPPPALLALSGDGAEVAITMPAGALSGAIACSSKTATFSFVSAADRTPVATATIPAAVKSALLVFVPAAKAPNTLPWRIFVVENSAKNFPDGGAFVANFHSEDIRFVIGENKLMLHPGGFYGVPKPAQRDDFNMAPVAFQFQQGDTWRNANESMLRFLPDMHYLMFTFVDPASGRPRVVTFQDAKPPAPAAALE